MKISRLKLENFRIFRGIHEFDLKDKKVILIEGSNGHGKSTIFDAICWVFTGELNRFSGSSEQSKFNYLVNNYEYQKQTYRVSVEVDIVNSDGSVSTIRREIRKLLSGNIDKKLFVEGKQYTIREGLRVIINLITKGNFINREQKLNSFSSIFASTQILSQETLEEFVKVDKPTDRYAKLENILGLDKYGKELKNYINKSKTAFENELDRIDSKLKDVENEIKRLDTRYRDNEYILDYTGEVSEAYLIDKLNTYFYSLPEHLVNYNAIKIKTLEDEDIQRIRTQRKELENKNTKLQSMNSRIHKFDITNSDFNEEQTKLDTSYKHLLNVNKKSKKREHGKLRAERRKNQLLVLEENLQEIGILQEELGDLKDKDNEIKNFLSYVNSNMKIKEIIEKYNNHSNFIQVFENEKEKKVKKLNELELKNKNHELEKIDRNLNSIESEIKAKKEKIEQVYSNKKNKNHIIEQLRFKKKDIRADNFQQITFSLQRSLLNRESEKECPVCGSDFKDVNTLLSHVEFKLKESQEKYDVVDIKLSEELSAISNIDNEIKSLQENIKSLEEKLTVTLENKKYIENKKIYLESIIGDLSDLDKVSIDSEIEKIENFINEHEHHYNLSKDVLEKLNELKSLAEIISLKEKKTESLKEPFKGKFSYFFNKEAITSRVKKLDDYLDGNKKSTKKLKVKKAQYESTIEGLRTKIDQIHYIVETLESDYPKTFDNYKINECLLYINQQSKLILDIDAEIAASLKNVSAFKEKDKLTEIQGQKEKTLKIKQNMDLDRTLVKENLSNIEILKKIHTNVQSDLINKYLNDNNKIIDQFFRQISPHAYYKHVKLVTRANDLYLLLSEGNDRVDLDDLTKEQLKQEVNANLNFSAAQSTILALSIFLALNITQNWSKLNIIGIDDPFQYLDDVNTYSFIDVLTSLINNEEKQIIVSTHNKNFSDLLMSKLSLPDENVQKISINSYSKKHIDITAANYVNMD
ncbi:AAA family ATPase [Mammaliicoccus vitulinus]|uniref:AAA family ATPase n=1 Tax=Mammaliicoccus vitulinus TaxID=71237 RepID=UPI00145AEB6A|nr:SMC family ATPase [Mammaliicoccus vitulinus]QJF25765.1 SMC family ATPase [Mammaliicoccus vitulinus]